MKSDYQGVTQQQAYRNGQSAGRKNFPPDSNPFLKSIVLGGAWFIGWQKGQSEFVETQPSGFHADFET